MVWDSNLKDEFEELKLKSAILNPCDFHLFETMYFKNSQILFLKEHLLRLINSALKFNFNTHNIFKDFYNILNQKSSYKEYQNFTLFKFDEKFSTKNTLYFIIFPYPLKIHIKKEF